MGLRLYGQNSELKGLKQTTKMEKKMVFLLGGIIKEPKVKHITKMDSLMVLMLDGLKMALQVIKNLTKTKS